MLQKSRSCAGRTQGLWILLLCACVCADAAPPHTESPRAEAYGAATLTSRAYRSLYRNWDVPAAIREFRDAIKMAPQDPAAHTGYSEALTAAGRHSRAIAEAVEAVRLERSSGMSLANYGRALFYARRYNDAAKVLRRAISRGAEPMARVWLAWSYDRLGKHDWAIAQHRIGIAAAGGQRTTVVASLGCSLAARGDQQTARAILEALESQGAEAAFGAAMVATAVGDYDRAFRSLELAVAARSEEIPFLAVTPHLERLRRDSRFDTLLGLIQARQERSGGARALLAVRTYSSS